MARVPRISPRRFPLVRSGLLAALAGPCIAMAQPALPLLQPDGAGVPPPQVLAQASAGRAPAAQPVRKPVVAQPIPADANAHVRQLNADTATPALVDGARGTPVLRAQVLLDRHWFSVGEIDGRYGSNTRRAVLAFQLARGLPVHGAIDEATWAALLQAPPGQQAGASAQKVAASGQQAQQGGQGQQGVQSVQGGPAPVFTTYTLTEQDVAGPWGALPEEPEQQAKLDKMRYETPLEALAERFHLDPEVLAALNEGRPVRAGQALVVVDVQRRGAPAAKAQALRIDKSDEMLYVMGEGDRVLAAFPVSFGGNQDPLPDGMHRIANKAPNPNFTLDPKLLRTVPDDKKVVVLPPGPNNPVGVMWLGLEKDHLGIHGTAEPSQMRRVTTNGCVRLTNWDVARLADLVEPGTPVIAQG